MGDGKDVDKYETITHDLADAFIESFRAITEIVHGNAVSHGFWSMDRNFGEAIALIHSEASEALEAHRSGNPKDDKVPEFSEVEIELADIIIRIMDLAAGYGYNIAPALLHKTLYNIGREYKHGKEY